MYLRKRENGGLVTTMSASSSSATHSGGAEVAAAAKRLTTLRSFLIRCSMSDRSMAPSSLASGTSVISTL